MARGPARKPRKSSYRPKWVVVKIVDNSLVGCIVGPFDSGNDAASYGEAAGKYSLGYERWETRLLQSPELALLQSESFSG